MHLMLTSNGTNWYLLNGPGVVGISIPTKITNPGPGIASFTSTKDYFTVNINDYPPSSEFGSAPGTNSGTVQGIVGAVALNSNAPPSVQNGYGVAGYASQGAGGFGFAGIGVFGSGTATSDGTLANPGLEMGLNGIASNGPWVGPLPTESGHNYMNMSGAELDINVMRLSNGAAPNVNAVGLSIVGSSEVAPDLSNDRISDAIFIQPLGISAVPPIGWNQGIVMTDGAIGGVGLNLGSQNPPGQFTNSSSISMTAYNGTTSPLVGTIQMLNGAGGYLAISAPASGQVGLNVNNMAVLNATPTAVIAAQPIVNTVMPTACSSQLHGTLWNNAGVVNVCP
jgi:hypothetical protein